MALNLSGEAEPMNSTQQVFIALYMSVLTVALIPTLLIVGWGNLPFASDEVSLILIVAITGGLGGFIQGLGSFVTYVGDRQLKASWFWWYILRPILGAGLAIIFYFALRGGLVFISTSSGTILPENINRFGICAIGGIAGMFSKEATDKLKEIAKAIFKEDVRSDSRSDQPDISKVADKIWTLALDYEKQKSQETAWALMEQVIAIERQFALPTQKEHEEYLTKSKSQP